MIRDEWVEKAAEAIHDDWQNGCRQWADTVEKLPGQADDFRRKARAALSIVAPLIIEECAKKADELDLYPATGWSEKEAHWWDTGTIDASRAIADHIRALSQTKGDG